MDRIEQLEALLRDAERRAFAAEAAHATLLRQVPGAIYAYAPEIDGPTLAMSSYVEELLGVPAARFLADDDVWDELLHPEDRDRAWADYASFLERGTPDHGDYRYVRPDGRVIWVHDRAAMVYGRDGEPLLVQGVMFDITASKEQALELQHLAYHDALTGLPNRAMVLDHLELALARARRTGGAVVVLFLDLDGLKPINDTHGHDVGDEVLAETARRLRGAMRDTDLVARHGGDEFVVLLADLGTNLGHSTDEVIACTLERIGACLDEPIATEAGAVSIRASAGHAVFPDDAADARALLRLADESMYASKRAPSVPSRQG